MNTVDDRITAALHAQAGSITQADLTPAAPPSYRVVRLGRARARWAVPLLAAVLVGILAVATVTAVQLSRSTSHPTGPATQLPVPPTPSTVAPTPAPSASTAVPTRSATQAPTRSATRAPSQAATTASASRPPATGAPGVFERYELLWPFGSYAEAEQWRTKGGGSQPWHLDAGQTALNFTRSYLGFTEIDQVTRTFFDDLGAHIGVGYRDPNGQQRTAAILHLVQYGTASDSPWEVVGSDDTTLSLEQPTYGSRVTSPMTIGGHITGVDENIVVRVLAGQTDRSTVAGPLYSYPAGGDHVAWTTGPVSVSQRGVLTLVASTGGHLQQVERFAIHGVHT